MTYDTINDARTLAGNGEGTPSPENGTPMDKSIGDGPTMRPKEERGVHGAFAPGDVIAGRYVVEKVLGEGGMGIVYQCLDKVGGVSVAVKCLPPEVSRNADELEDIRANYRLVADLHHPNIAGARTLEFDEATGDYYLVMDLARGTTLKRWARRHPDAGLDAKLAILRQVAAALDYAHAEKVIHRDVKPENVMVDDDGRVKVLDFGLAAQIRSSQSRTSNTVTSKGGTPGYKSPEQWLGRPQQALADVYAFGVMAYWLFSGRLPFDGDDPTVLGHAVLSAPVEPITDLPAHMNAALAKALAKEPKDRFSSCGAFVDALEGRSAGEDRACRDLNGRLPSPHVSHGTVALPHDRIGDRHLGGLWKTLLIVVVLILVFIGGWWYVCQGQDLQVSPKVAEGAIAALVVRPMENTSLAPLCKQYGLGVTDLMKQSPDKDVQELVKEMELDKAQYKWIAVTFSDFSLEKIEKGESDFAVVIATSVDLDKIVTYAEQKGKSKFKKATIADVPVYISLKGEKEDGYMANLDKQLVLISNTSAGLEKLIALYRDGKGASGEFDSFTLGTNDVIRLKVMKVGENVKKAQPSPEALKMFNFFVSDGDKIILGLGEAEGALGASDDGKNITLGLSIEAAAAADADKLVTFAKMYLMPLMKQATEKDADAQALYETLQSVKIEAKGNVATLTASSSADPVLKALADKAKELK